MLYTYLRYRLWNWRILVERLTQTIAKLDPSLEILNPLEYGMYECYEAYLERYFLEGWPYKVVIGPTPAWSGNDPTGFPLTDAYHLQAILGMDLKQYTRNLPNERGSYLERLPVFAWDNPDPASRLFHEAALNLGCPEDFYTNVLLLSICPLVFLRKRVFSIENVFYHNLHADIQQAIRDFETESYHRAFRGVLSPSQLVAIGFWAQGTVREIHCNPTDTSFLPYPSPHALAAYQMTEEQWKVLFRKVFTALEQRSDILRRETEEDP